MRRMFGPSGTANQRLLLDFIRETKNSVSRGGQKLCSKGKKETQKEINFTRLRCFRFLFHEEWRNENVPLCALGKIYIRQLLLVGMTRAGSDSRSGPTPIGQMLSERASSLVKQTRWLWKTSAVLKMNSRHEFVTSSINHMNWYIGWSP